MRRNNDMKINFPTGDGMGTVACGWWEQKKGGLSPSFPKNCSYQKMSSHYKDYLYIYNLFTNLDTSS